LSGRNEPVEYIYKWVKVKQDKHRTKNVQVHFGTKMNRALPVLSYMSQCFITNVQGNITGKITSKLFLERLAHILKAQPNF
jgi:hypothetical protein